MHRSSKHHRGFVSVYFLAVFLLMTSLYGIIQINLQNRLKTEINMQKATAYLSQEAIALASVKCALANKSYESVEESSESVSYSITFYEQSCEVIISSPLPEQLIVTLDLENQIIEKYEAIRNEEPA